MGMCNQSCSNGGATYIIREIIAKDNLNRKFDANL